MPTTDERLPLYPSYMDFDRFIDVERLRSLDGYLRERIGRRASAADAQFYTGPFLLDADQSRRPGSRMIYLARSTRADDYYDLDRPEIWAPSEDSAEFAGLMEFIATLPFARTGRMLIMYDFAGSPVTAHRDHDDVELCHEFVWLRTNRTKPFYMLDPETGEQRYVESYSAWFDTVNQYHGADGSPGLAFSIRVDGIFSDAFRRQIPIPEKIRSSAPALWAAQVAAEAGQLAPPGN